MRANQAKRKESEDDRVEDDSHKRRRYSNED